MFTKMIWLFTLLINVLMYTTIAKNEDHDNTISTINPAFTEITPRVLPLTFSDRNILWKRLKGQDQDQDQKAGMMVIVKRTASHSSGGVETISPQTHSPKSLSHHNRDSTTNPSIDSLADKFKTLSLSSSPNTLSHHNSDSSITPSIDSLAKKFNRLSLSTSPPRRQNSSTSKSNRLPPRPPSRSPSSSLRTGIDAFSGRRKSHSKLRTESHEPLTKRDPAPSSKGFRCTCSKIGGVCGC